MEKRRRIPAWLEERETKNDSAVKLDMKESTKEFKIISPIIKENVISNELTTLPKRTLRSNSSLGDNQVTEKKKISEYPFINFQGEIKYLTTSIDIACASDEVMQWVNKQDNASVIPIAFDMEWPFDFKTGPGKSAVIQICADESICYVFHIFPLKKLPAALVALLRHPKVRLHGVNIKNDFRKLQRDYPDVNADALIEQCIDLGTWCNEVCNTGGRWSLERLVSYICKLRIDKNKKVRMSKWHIVPLDEDQRIYAAIDVYISQVIYRELEKRENIKKSLEAEFLVQHGERALKVIKALGDNFI